MCICVNVLCVVKVDWWIDSAKITNSFTANTSCRSIFLPDLGLREASKACCCDQCPFITAKLKIIIITILFGLFQIKSLFDITFSWKKERWPLIGEITKIVCIKIFKVQECRVYTRTYRCKLKKKHTRRCMHVPKSI